MFYVRQITHQSGPFECERCNTYIVFIVPLEKHSISSFVANYVCVGSTIVD